MSDSLNQALLNAAARQLALKIPQFHSILDRFGIPPLWDRPNDFATLLHIILEQQVSLASAKATYTKLTARLGAVNPENFLKLNDAELKGVGFSQQKTRYGRIVATEINENRLSLKLLSGLDDAEAKNILMSIKGIGHWTSDIYLLMVLLKPDIWPHGDRALAVAACEVFNMEHVPSYTDLQKMAEDWKPWRSVAARFLWHYYLSTPRKKL